MGTGASAFPWEGGMQELQLKGTEVCPGGLLGPCGCSWVCVCTGGIRTSWDMFQKIA